MSKVGRVAPWLSALLLVSLLSGAGPAVSTEPAPPGAGTAGAGDSYYPEDGNGGFDVRHYDVHDTYRPGHDALTGWTDVSATATQGLSSFHLDLLLRVDAVTVDAQDAAFEKVGPHELVVTPVSPLTAGEAFVVRVAYHGEPASLSYGGEKAWRTRDDEATATSEPHMAAWWFPSNDHPGDKATFDLTFAAPSGLQVIGNGELLGTEAGTGEDGDLDTWHWRMDRPMATYLAFVAVGRFRIERGTYRGRPWLDAVSRWYPRAMQDEALRLLRRSPRIVAWLETQFGGYPFTSTGGVVSSLYRGFALENQGRPTYPFLSDDRAGRLVVVHELAHQWFGDDVSVARWRDIWLNEGFATWAEWRWTETHGGEAAQHRLRRSWAARPARARFWDLKVADPGERHLFDRPVYVRGAMTLQALRHRLGTTAFLRLMRTWAQEHRGGTVRTAQFHTLAERVSGQDLDRFFATWLHSGSRPAPTTANGL